MAYYEEQKLSEWITVPLSMLFLYNLIKAILAGKIVFILITLLFVIPLIILLWFFKMKTLVDANVMRITMIPFVKRSIAYDEIKSWHIKKYRPILDYGGWGVRIGLRHSRAYNMRGNIGIQLILINNEKIIIGTQEPDEFSDALRKHIPDKELVFA